MIALFHLRKIGTDKHDASNPIVGNMYPDGKRLLKVTFSTGEIRAGGFRPVFRSLFQRW